MPIIDVQVHAYATQSSGAPLGRATARTPTANGEEMVAAMDAVGVERSDHRLHVQPLPLRSKLRLEVYRAYPRRFRVVKPIDVTDPAIDEVVAEWAKTKGAVGVRIMLRDELPSDPADTRVNRAFAAAGKHGLPVNFLCWGRLDHGTELVRRNPDTAIVIDHLGLLQPNEPPRLAEPWADLPKLLALAAYPNVRV